MSLITKLANRFVFDRKSSLDPAARGFISFISLISMTGLALGVTALLAVTSVMNGFERELKSALTAFHGHILVFSRAEPFENPDAMLSEMKATFPEIEAISPYFYLESMLSSKNAIAGVVIEGVDRDTLDSVSKVGNKLTDGKLPEGVKSANLADTDIPEITLGFEIAKKLKAEVGDNIVLTIPFAKKNDTSDNANASPIIRKLKVVGIVKLGMYDYDNKYVIMDGKDLSRILKIKASANSFKILTNDLMKSIHTTNAINDKYAYPIRARDWSSLNRNLFFAIEMEKIVISIVLMAIVLVASFNIVSTLMMLVHDKKRQISMLKAMGFRKRSTLILFLFIGGILTAFGVLMGLGLARAITLFMEWKSIIDIPPDIYGLSRLPIEIRSWEWLAICIFVMVLAFFATLWPALKISRDSPVEGLRYE